MCAWFESYSVRRSGQVGTAHAFTKIWTPAIAGWVSQQLTWKFEEPGFWDGVKTLTPVIDPFRTISLEPMTACPIADRSRPTALCASLSAECSTAGPFSNILGGI